MQELKNLRVQLHKVRGSIKRVAANANVSEELVRKVFQGVAKNERVIKAALVILDENKKILAEREAKQQALENEIKAALASC